MSVALVDSREDAFPSEMRIFVPSMIANCYILRRPREIVPAGTMAGVKLQFRARCATMEVSAALKLQTQPQLDSASTQIALRAVDYADCPWG
jgi:hypothetical protein